MQETPLYRYDFKPATNVSSVESMDELKALVDSLYSSDKIIGFDIETGYSGADYERRSLNVQNPHQFVVGFSITNDPTWARYVPLRHDFGNNLDPNEVWSLMKPLLEDKVGVAHNAAFEAENMAALDLKGDGPSINIPLSRWHDSMIQAFVLSDIPTMQISGALAEGDYIRRYLPPHLRTDDLFWRNDIPKAFGVGLKELTFFRYNYAQGDIFSLFNGGKELTAVQKKKIRFNPLPIDSKVVRYAADDAYCCLQLHLDQIQRLEEDPYLPKVYRLEMQVADVLVDMKKVGVAVDWEGIEDNYRMFQDFLHEAKVATKEKFEEEVGRELIDLNLNSPQQINKLIYGPEEEGGMGMAVARTTATGAPSTDEKALTLLRKKSPAIDSLLRYRQCEKMGGWFKQWRAFRGQTYEDRLYPNFNQVQVQSGRFASSNPNVQNVAKRWWFQNSSGTVAELMAEGVNGKDYWTGNARDFIKASEGYQILSFDYKSAEIQMLAALAGEESVIEAFYSGEDFHKWTASLVFSKTVGEVTKAERQAAKTVSFGLVYGQSVSAMAQQLGIPVDEAQSIKDKYFARFPKIAKFFDDQHKMVADALEVRTWLGRKATVWEAMHDNRGVRSKAERMSVNIPVQGGATGDYTKLAMVRAANTLKAKGWWNTKVRLLMNQHDSLVFEVHNSLSLEEVIQTLTPEVEYSLKGATGCFNTFNAFPPMSVDWEAAPTWGSVYDVGGRRAFEGKELRIDLSDLTKADDLKLLRDVLVTNPGHIPVTLHLKGRTLPLKFGARPHPSILDKIKKGDPDIGIPSPRDSVVTSAEFVV